MQAEAILKLALTLLPYVQTGITEFVKWVNTLRGAMQQSGEWTPELEATFRAALWARTQDPAYQPDR